MQTAYSHLSEYELLQQLEAGSEAAYKEVYDRYWGLLFLHALKMLQSEEEARDVVQELFVHLWSRHTSSGDIIHLSAYLYTAVRNRVINELARQRNAKRVLAAFRYHTPAHYSPIMEKIQEKELAEIIENEYQHLPEKMRRIFELSRKEALSHKEIARILHISDKTVKKQVGNVIKQIKLKLSYIFLFTLTWNLLDF